VNVCGLLLKELLYLLLFMCWTCTVTFKSTSPLPLIFLFYGNDLPTIIKINSKLVFFANDTSFIITNPSPIDLKTDISTAYVQLNKWFNANLLFFKL